MEIKKEFKDHKLTIIQEDWENHICCYYCARPETGIFSFYILTGPDGFLTVYGDIGRHSFRRHNTNMVGWLRGSIGSKRYILEKLTNLPNETEVLNPELVDKFYKEEIEELEKELHSIFSEYNVQYCDIYSKEEQEKIKEKMKAKEVSDFFELSDFEETLIKLETLVECQEEWSEFISYKAGEDRDLGGDLYDLLQRTGDEESISSFFVPKGDVEWSYEALKCFVYLYNQHVGEDD